jgi:branched-subunit amino acid transport protein
MISLDPWIVWPAIFLLFAASVCTRGAFILLFPRVDIPPVIRRALRYVAPAIFAALVAPDLLLAGNQVSISVGNSKFVAAIVAALVAWRTRNALITIFIGMMTLHGLRYFGST